MKWLRVVVVGAVFLSAGLLGATAALGAGELSVVDPVDKKVYFGESDVPVTESITLTNGGDEQLVVDVEFDTYPGDDPLQGEFSHDVPGDSFTIDPDQDVVVQVSWDPSGDRAERAIIRFTPDVGDTIDVDLGGGKPFLIEPAGLSLDLGNVNVAQSDVDFNSHGRIRLRHTGPAFPNVVVDDCPTKSNGASFTIPCNPASYPKTLTTINNVDSFRVGFYPESTGFKETTVSFLVDSETVEIDVSGTGVVGDVLYRVNSGGPIVNVDSTQSFTRDQVGSRSVYFLEGDGSAITNNAVIDKSHSSIPTSTPVEIFASARLEGNSATPISYGFPVDADKYTVRLFFVEADPNITGPGQRVFDVSINGSIVIPDLDPYAVAGGRDKAFARAFLVDADDEIAIEVERQLATPPVLSGVEIEFGGSVNLTADDVAFGSVPVGGSDTEVLTITNNAPADGAAIRIDGVALSGSGAGDYEVTGLGAPVWLAPGEDLELDVEFTPSQAGARPATATLDLHGAADLEVDLTGSGLAGNLPPVAVDDVYETEQDTSLVVAAPGVLSNDTDADGNPLSAALVGGPTYGGLNLTANGGFTYSPVAGFYGTDSFTYKANDSLDDSNTATVIITVNAADPDPDPDPEPDPDPDPDVSFVDIDDSTFTQDILWLAKVGITRGCNPPANDRFCPDDFVTRGQMAAFFVRALDLTDRLDDPFVDDDGDTFEVDIEKLAAADITRGCNPPTNDRFCPDDDVTRGQMAAFFVRALDLTDRLDDPFVDDDGNTFEADIEKLAAADITRGCNPPTNDRFCPNDFVTRGQMAAFFHRAADLLGLPG